ncbi:ATP-binding protein [Thermoanaerobacter sp. RKWS2]|uniref:ATP-binding protein n=1 Tax=Thermoanaerobacter sp. RKWS2 TaxID=2983842 RepID=UPI00224B17EF|nr:AAA family ATPase [Thermoanaerobacter sp. RKWS2]UZQ81793.1 AAA family ATPase [Thermoanaerobacter sp. RKWS2]
MSREYSAEQMKNFIKKRYEGAFLRKAPQDALFVEGPPGVGKTVGVKDAAKEFASKYGLRFADISESSSLELERLLNEKDVFVFYDLNLSTREPSDISGIPRIDERSGYVYMIPPLWAKLMERHPGILFIDEITNVQRPDLLTIGFKLIGEKLAGDSKLNNNIMIITAGNPREHNYLANALPAPLINRMQVLRIKEPSKEEWFNYARQRYPEIPADITAYMSSTAARPVKVSEEEAYTTPRSCEKYLKILSDILYIEPNIDTRELSSMMEGIISQEDHYAFMGYYKERNTIIRYLQEGKEISDPAARWAAFVYLGSLIREYYNTYKEGSSETFITRHGIIEKERLPEIVKKAASSQEEHLVPLVLGAQLFTAGQSPLESYKPALFLIELANGRGIEEAFKEAQKERNLTITDWHNEFEEHVSEVFKGHAVTEPAKATAKAVLRSAVNQYTSVLENILKRTIRVDESVEKYIGKEAADQLRRFYKEDFTTHLETTPEQTVDAIILKRKQPKNSINI